MEDELRRELKMLETRVEALERTQTHIDKVITDNSETLKDIKDALIGDSFRKQGLISTVEGNVEDIKKLKIFKNRLVAYTAVATGTIVTVIEILSQIFF